jgi:hypothetical protein
VLGVTVTEVMGIGDVAPSLFGECPHQQAMHFCGAGHVWVDDRSDSHEPMEIETAPWANSRHDADAEAMPIVRFRAATSSASRARRANAAARASASG